jgi:HD superfamily phosphohydrolase
MELKIKHKQIHDNIHGPIPLSNYACRIIDNKLFERLRYLKQLGTCYFVFPSATHTRFEHSLGTYHLCSWILKSIKENSSIQEINNSLSNVPELNDYYTRMYGSNDITDVCDYNKLDAYVCELVKIAGLCHDLGHGPFSHLFDDVFIPLMRNANNDEYHPNHIHENRSCLILQTIIENDQFLSSEIMQPEIDFIKTLINPSKDHLSFIYQIVSNNFNAIDVDKFDYLVRDSLALGLKFGFDYVRLLNDAKVINNIICYPIQMYNEVSAIFDTRYRLHKQVYSHKVVISSQYMINDIMIKMEPIVKMYEMTTHIDKFYKFTDSYIIEVIKFLDTYRDVISEKIDKKVIDDVNKLWVDINERRMYLYVGSIVSKVDKQISLEIINQLDPSIDLNKIVLHKSKIGFVSGKKSNPFDQLYFYNNNEPTKCMKINKEKITFLISDTYQEYIYILYVKDRNDTELVKKMKNIFNLLK